MQPICPDEEMLADYIEGRLSGKERSKIEEHLCDCNICRDYFITAGSLVRGNGQFASDPAPAALTRSSVFLVKNLDTAPKTSLAAGPRAYIRNLYRRISDLMTSMPWVGLHPAMVRSSRKVISKDCICLKKTFKEIDTEIEIEKTGKNKSRIRVRMPDANRHKSKIRVALKKGEREMSSHLLIEDCLFEEISFGHYSLAFSRDGKELGNCLFEIKESSNE